MSASNFGKALFVGAALLFQAGLAVPAFAVEAEPLPDSVLREITGTGIGPTSLPEYPRGQADRLVAPSPNAEMDMNRRFAEFQPILNLIGAQVVRNVFTNSQSATNLSLAVSLDNTNFVVSIQR